MRSIPSGRLKSLRPSCGEPADPLSLPAHTAGMEPTKPQKVVLLVLGLFMLVAWALIIWVATVVTHTALETLQYIVDLSQMDP
jgi:hypothetical protein